MAVLASVLVLLVLLAASASATAPLSKGEAKAASISGLQQYYGDTWRNGTEKLVGHGDRVSRTRWRFDFSFRFAGDEGCFGVVTVWRGRYGRIFTNVQPDPELTSARCF